MTNLSKNRSLSIIAAGIMALTWLSAFAALWNSLLTSDVKKEGWVVFFMILVLISGALLFYLAYISADEAGVEQIRKDAFETGRSEVLQEFEKTKKAEAEQLNEANDFQKIIDDILASVHGTRSESTFCNKLLAALARELEIVQGIMYVTDKKEKIFRPVGEYALTDRKPEPFKPGDNLAGQVALNKSMDIHYDIPEKYFTVASGLGKGQPKYLIVAPLVHDNETIAVLELAAFKKPDEVTRKILDQVLSETGLKLNKLITA
jgi:hypothetical protein